MDSFLPRGVVPSPQDKQPQALHPSEDLNFTIKNLLDTNSQLEDRIEELEGDKRHFQMKLEEYIRYEREEGSEKLPESHLERQVKELTAQNAILKTKLLQMEENSNPPSHFSERDQRALLLQRVNELQTAARICQDHHGHQIEKLRGENARLKQEIERKNMYTTTTTTTSSSREWRGDDRPSGEWKGSGPSGGPSSDWRRPERPSGAWKSGGPTGESSGEWRGTERPSGEWRGPSGEWRGDERPSSCGVVPYHQYQRSTASGHSSLPESLPTTSGGGAGGGAGHLEMPNMTNLTLSSGNSKLSLDPSNSDALELKKLKKQLEKYKSANIELDQKLKDAKLELRRYSERLGDSDVVCRMDVERFRSENALLQSRLDRTLSDNNYLRSMVARR